MPSRILVGLIATVLSVAAVAQDRKKPAQPSVAPATLTDASGVVIGPVVPTTDPNNIGALWRSPYGTVRLAFSPDGYWQSNRTLFFASTDCTGPLYVAAGAPSEPWNANMTVVIAPRPNIGPDAGSIWPGGIFRLGDEMTITPYSRLRTWGACELWPPGGGTPAPLLVSALVELAPLSFATPVKVR
jgi:hypothetical protein